MDKNQISVFQLVVLLYVCRSFNLFTAILHDVGAGYGAVHLAAFPLAAVFQLALMAPAYLLTRATGRGLGESAAAVMGRWGLWFPVLGAGYLLTTTSLTVYCMANFLVNTTFPGASALFFAGTLVLAAGYAASLGTEGIARAALILCVAFSLGLLAIFLGVIQRLDPLNIQPFPLNGGAAGVIRSAWKIAARSSPVFTFAALSHKTRGKGVGKGFLWYLLASLVLQEIVTFLVAAALGDLAAAKAFPLFTLTTVSQISVFQRMDALHLGVWTAISFLRIAANFCACGELLRPFAPKGETAAGKRRLLVFFMAIAACGGGALIGSLGLLRRLLEALSSGWPLAAALFFGPLLLLGVFGIQKRRERGRLHEVG